jgi:succinate dehydrogenase / fumarate reductase, flavoprotein subunit
VYKGNSNISNDCAEFSVTMVTGALYPIKGGHIVVISEELEEVLSTDLLIIGGGFGGEIAAIKAKEAMPDINVLLVDKQTIGYAGKASKGGGMLDIFEPDQSVDKFIEYHVKNIGMYLEDQELLRLFAQETMVNMKDLDRWGASVCRDDSGNFAILKNEFNALWSYYGIDLNMMLPLRAVARKLGVKMLNKVHVVDLLKKNNKVVGAAGFNIVDGKFYVLKAKAVVLANGSCNFRAANMWVAGTGDGIAAAYRAGAEMRSAEFGNSAPNIWVKDTDEVIDPRLIFNARGDNLSQTFETKGGPDTPLGLVLGIEKEVIEGRGPIYEDRSKASQDDIELFADFSVWKRPYADKFHSHTDEKKREQGYPVIPMFSKMKSPKREVTIRVISEFSPIKVNHDMQTTVEGLWAIGDTCWAGSALVGACPPPAKMRGSGLGFTVFSASRGGSSAAQFAAKISESEIDNRQVKRLKRSIFAPLQRKSGFLPNDAIFDIQKIIIPAEYNLRRSENRMMAALSKLDDVKNKLSDLVAQDYHYLGKCHEVKSVALCAEMNFRAALMRKESRGWHYREDYPERDDKNWLKWVKIKNSDGKMILSTEPVPIANYTFKP